jgi:hypothetical protein
MTNATNLVDDALDALVAEQLGAFLAEAEVSEVGAVEGGLVDVVRRGRRERLQHIVQGGLFLALRERGADTDVVETRLTGGRTLFAAPLCDGRVALCVRNPIARETRLEQLVIEGFLPAGIDAELVAAVHEGRGVAVVGPSRLGRLKLASALARAVGSVLRCGSITPEAPSVCTPAPGIAHLVARARSAVALGADVVFAAELSVRDLSDLATHPPGAVLVASVVAPSFELAAAAGGPAFAALCPLVAVVGFAPDGQPRLCELHGNAPSVAADVSPATAESSMSTAPLSTAPRSAAPMSTASGATVADAPSPASLARASAMAAGATVLGQAGRFPSSLATEGVATTQATSEVPVVMGEAPPADWASADADDDPGWELGNLARSDGETARGGGAFDAALAAVAKRPAYTPRGPSAHPAMHTLRGTGGLTFEPPPGPSDDGDR